MSTQSSIEWTDATWNPVRGCSKVSAGCQSCYAMGQAHRFSGPGKPYEGLTQLVRGKGPQWTGVVRTVPEALRIPLRWKKPRRVFVNSMSDLFHEDVPDAFIDRVFAVMCLTPHHTYQILTKRPERMAEFLSSVRVRTITWGFNAAAIWDLTLKRSGSPPNPGWPLPNVWLGTSVEDQAAANERIPHLLRTPAAVRFLSCEPLLGPVDLTRINLGECQAEFFDDPSIKRARFNVNALTGAKSLNWPGLSWVIAGGESGPDSRTCDVRWIRRIVGDCKDAGVACFVKQLGARPFGDRCPHDGGTCHHGCWDTCYRNVSGMKLTRVSRWPKDRKGGDPREWPQDLRVREFPEEIK